MLTPVVKLRGLIQNRKMMTLRTFLRLIHLPVHRRRLIKAAKSASPSKPRLHPLRHRNPFQTWHRECKLASHLRVPLNRLAIGCHLAHPPNLSLTPGLIVGTEIDAAIENVTEAETTDEAISGTLVVASVNIEMGVTTGGMTVDLNNATINEGRTVGKTSSLIVAVKLLLPSQRNSLRY